MKQVKFLSIALVLCFITHFSFAGVSKVVPAGSTETKSMETVVKELDTKIEATKMERAELKSLSKVERKAYRSEMKQLKKQRRAAKFMNWYTASSTGEKGFIAAIICFFLGGLAIHRVYMGGSIILVLGYFLTFGGIFGLLPLIDFFRLLMGHEGHYEGNNAFFAAFG